MRSSQTVTLGIHQLSISFIGNIRVTTKILPTAEHQTDKVQIGDILLLVESQKFPQLLDNLLHLRDSPGAVDQLGHVPGVLVHVGRDQGQQGDRFTSSYTITINIYTLKTVNYKPEGISNNEWPLASRALLSSSM